MIKYLIKGIELFLYGILMYILYLFLPKNIWIISERVDQAQDNGRAFFEYLNKKHPEIKSVYLLEKDCKSIAEMRQIGDIIIKGSVKHKLYFLKSRVIAFTEKNMIEPWGSNIFYSRFGSLFPKKLKVFLQHGITDKDVSCVYGKHVSNIDIFMTVNEQERDFIIDRFGYNREEVPVVGFTRYDALYTSCIKEGKENLIIFMPTWRRYLIDLQKDNEEYFKELTQVFRSSEYYKSIQGFLNSNKLHRLLADNNYKLLFITHHAMNVFEETFISKSSHITICKSEEIKIAEQLKRAKIFITDYSSVHFDSAYIGNFNIYYQFDKEDFQSAHAGKSYFEYERDGFGPVVYNKDELIEQLENTIKRDGSLDDRYNLRRQRFFKYADSNNCRRTYEVIQHYLSK